MNDEGTNFLASLLLSQHSDQWRSGFYGLNLVSETLLAIAFFSMSIALLFFLKKRSGVSYKNWILALYTFIYSYGLSIVIGLWAVWNGDYVLQSISKGVAGLVSMLIVIALIYTLFKLFRLKRNSNLDILKEKISLQEMLIDKLTRTEQQLRCLLNQSPDGMLLNNRHGAIEYSNQRAQQILGYTGDELKELYVTDLLPENLRHKLSPEHNDLYDEQKAISEVVGIEINVMSKGDIDVPVEINIKPIEISSDEQVFLTTVRDITGRKERESDKRRELMQIEHISRLSTVGQMATGLAHELNQPLTAISANLHTAMSIYKNQSKPNPEILNIMQENYASAKRAGDIIKSVRQFISKDSGDLKNTDLNKLVSETLDLILTEAQSFNVVLSSELGEGLSKVLVDPVQIQQVIVNLGRNAIEALSNQKDIKPKLVMSTQMYSTNMVIVKVKDNGIGLTDKEKSLLFKPYKTTKEKGMGLGLTICRSIVEGVGGRLWYEDDQNPGTEFCFTLPVMNGAFKQ